MAPGKNIKDLEQKIEDLIQENFRLKKIESDLKDSQEKLKMLFDEAPDAYFISDVKGNFIDGNSVAEKLIGYKREELIGKNMAKLNLVPVDQIPIILKRLADHALGKGTSAGDLVILRRDGTRVQTEVSGNVISLGNKKVVLGIVRDISARKKIEEEINQKNAELERFKELAVGRELQMVELKNKIKELEEKLAKKQ